MHYSGERVHYSGAGHQGQTARDVYALWWTVGRKGKKTGPQKKEMEPPNAMYLSSQSYPGPDQLEKYDEIT